MSEKTILDLHRQKITVGMKLRVCHCTGRYGQVTIDEGEIMEINRYFGVYLKLLKPTKWASKDGIKHLNIGDRHYIPLPGQWDFALNAHVCDYVHRDYDHGHHAWAEIMRDE